MGLRSLVVNGTRGRRRSTSDVIDRALDRLIHSERLRRDVAAYRRISPTGSEAGLAPLEAVDLDDTTDWGAALRGRRGVSQPSPRRGEIWLAQLDKVRPVVVLTREPLGGILSAVIGAPVTSTVRGLSTELALGPDDGLRVESVATPRQRPARRPLPPGAPDRPGAGGDDRLHLPRARHRGRPPAVTGATRRWAQTQRHTKRAALVERA